MRMCGCVRQVRTQLSSGASTGADTPVQWTFVRCSSNQYAVLANDDSDAVECRQCPNGADCSGAVSSYSDVSRGIVDVVTLANVVVQPGYWASPISDGLTYYACPIAAACLHGTNESRSECAVGYTGIACSVCAPQYFEQFGKCVACPPSSGASAGALVGIATLLLVLCYAVFRVRSILPVDVLKLGVSMLQV